MANEPKEIRIAEAQIRFPNLGGRPDQYNPEGKRSFNVVLPGGLADELEARGWNVKRREASGDFPAYAFLRVEAKFKADSPKVLHDPEIVMVSTDGEGNKVGRRLDAETAGEVDSADIDYVDLVISPYRWSAPVGAGSGIKAYVKSMYVNVRPRAFADKYSGLRMV